MSSHEEDKKIEDIVEINVQEMECNINWKKFIELEAFHEDTRQEQLHAAAVKKLEGMGVLSMERDNKYGLLVDGMDYGGPYLYGIKVYFTKKEDAKAYADVKWKDEISQGLVSVIHILPKE